MSREAKVYVIHENDAWLPPLRSAFADLGTPFEEWHLDRLTLDLDEAPPHGVFFSRMSASNYTRGHVHANQSTAIVLRWLEAHGRRVINGSQVLQLELSKPAQQLALASAGFETPRSVVAVGRRELVGAARRLGLSPFIVKPGQGGKGLGVQAFAGIDDLERALGANAIPDSVDDVWLVQEKIDSPDDHITRAEFVGGAFVYAVRVHTAGSFELCPADVCETEPAGFCPANANENPSPQAGPRFEVEQGEPDPVVGRLETFLAGHGIEVAGVEFIRRRDGTPVIYDINTNTNYNAAAEREAGLAEGGMARIARFLSGELDGAAGMVTRASAAR